MKKYINKLVFIMLTITAVFCCCNRQANDKEQANKPKEKTLEEVLKERKDYYDYLCIIGENKWSSFDEYNDFISVDSNWQHFHNELKQKGYDFISKIEIENALRTIKYGFDTIVEVPQRIEFDMDYIAFLFVKMRKADICTETYAVFKEKIFTDEGFVWCYKESEKIGITDGWLDFITHILRPNYEECKDEIMEEISMDEEWIQDIIEQYQM